MTTRRQTFGITESDPFAILGNGWALQSVSRSETAQVHGATDMMNRYMTPAVCKMRIENVTATYRAVSAGGNQQRIRVLFDDNTDGLCVTGVSVETKAGAHAVVTISGHRHIDKANNRHVRRGYVADIPAFPYFGASAFGLSLGIDEDALQSGTYAVSIGHEDEPGMEGDFLCGSSAGIRHDASFEAVEDVAFSTPRGWVSANAGDNSRNTAFRRREAAFTKHQTD